jgi:hypothetical protein
VFDRVKARIFGKRPAGEDAFRGSVQQEFVDFDKGRGLGHLRGRVRVASSGGDFERAEGYRLAHLNFERRNAPGDLVEPREDGDRI